MQDEADPNDDAAPKPEQGDAENRMGGEPEEESGAGYGNHAMPDVGEQPSAPDAGGR